MSYHQKILFIINPISGGFNKKEIIKAIPNLLPQSKFDVSISHSKRAGHAKEIAKSAVEKEVDIVVAVGGDGTINEIAAQLVNTNTTLAIIPCGSGNGLARDLGISLNYKEAIKTITALNIREIDVGVCNNQHFFSLTGAGYDAQVAYDFNRTKKRKFYGYAWAILKDYFFAKEHHYEIELDNETISGKFFFVVTANCSQWGYGVKVAPAATLDDGTFGVVLCKKPHFFCLCLFLFKMLIGRLDTSKYCTYKTSEKVSLRSNNKFFYHLDGDTKGITQQANIHILHKALKIIGK